METIWVYKPPQCGYFVARRTPFGFFTPTADQRSGNGLFTMIQGVAMNLPAWEWKKRVEGIWFAGFSGNIYEISDIELPPFLSGPPRAS